MSQGTSGLRPRQCAQSECGQKREGKREREGESGGREMRGGGGGGEGERRRE